MDSGWAVVIGAAIALIGSSVVPWVRENVRERTQAARTRRAEIADALTRVGGALGETARAVILKTPESMSTVASAWATLLELELLLDKSEGDIATIGREALQLVFSGDSRGAPAAYARAVAAWHRDGVTPAEALELFKSLILAPSPGPQVER